jgi:quinoprotein glucose dehydrogenase
LSAIDLASGKLLWSHPFGTAKGSAPLGLPQPLPLPMGALNHGGSVATRSGLLFIGASKDGYIRAFDARTGRELWKSALPGSGQSTPIVYSVGGRQFVVISAGGSAALQVKLGTALVAYALPVDRK